MESSSAQKFDAMVKGAIAMISPWETANYRERVELLAIARQVCSGAGYIACEIIAAQSILKLGASIRDADSVRF